ncbi:MAG TPA: hypothetical protein VG826_16870 [Pirellulales bacterium]|nr:hypothetical protein [Pirellulales bacterium]
MKRMCVPLLAVALLAVVAWLTGEAGASDWANPTASPYYSYAAGGNAYGLAGYNADMAGYPGYSYNGSSYAGYSYGAYGGYGGYGYGGYGGCDGCGRKHCCSFGGNSVCCGDCWDGYPGNGCGVKVRRRHRPLGCGAGPCVDPSCSYLSAGYATNCGRHHRCHLRRNRNMGYCATCGCSECGGGTVMDQVPAQPSMSGPTPVESLETPPPSTVEPPSPGDDSST